MIMDHPTMKDLPFRISSPPAFEPEHLRNQFRVKLHHDVLDLVLCFVSLNCQEDLFRICRASKQLYFACIPWLYRDITIDFSDRPGLALLRRLSQVHSKIPTYVRTVRLKECGHSGAKEWELLIKCLHRFQRLLNLSWDNHADLSESVLDILHHYHPRALIQANVTQIYPEQLGDPHLERSFFNSPASKQLTSLDLSVKSDDIFYDDFKEDLIELLRNAPRLKYLGLFSGPDDNRRKVFPEMMLEIENSSLPKLRSLHLSTKSRLFTRRELEAWGARNGWSKLQHLTVSCALHLIAFVSRVPRLTHLDLTEYEGQHFDELEERLESCTGRPLGVVKNLAYAHSIGANHAAMHVMPWSILKHISTTLTEYYSWHQPHDLSQPGFAIPSVADLTRFQAACPNLTGLTLDLQVTGRDWPLGPLKQLAALRNLEKLWLYVHYPTEEFIWIRNCLIRKFIPRVSFKEGFKIITDMQAKPPFSQNLRVKFKEVRAYKYMADNWDIPDLECWMDDTGEICSVNPMDNRKSDDEIPRRKKYTGWTLQQLRELESVTSSSKETSHVFRRNERACESNSTNSTFWDVAAEIWRREKDGELEKLYGDDSVTLFDRWTCDERS